MRDTIWVLWQLRENDENSEMFYKKVMGVLRGLVLKKIATDKHFMEDQILLAADYN